jgi:potassium channel subfamily K
MAIPPSTAAQPLSFLLFGLSAVVVTCSGTNRDCEWTEASIAPSLLQRQHSIHSDVSAPRAGALSEVAAAASQPEVLKAKSPLHNVVSTIPAWAACLLCLGVLLSIFLAISALSKLLNNYEASRWSEGKIGRPWYTDDDMQLKVGFGALGLWIAFGLLFFTQLVYFDTPEGLARPLTFVEAFYLCVQILTTVGYGDLTPSDPPGQVLVAFFILIGIILVGVNFTELLKTLCRKAELAVARGLHTAQEAFVDRRASQKDCQAEQPAADAAGGGPVEPTTPEARRQQCEQDLEMEAMNQQFRQMYDFLLSMGPFLTSIFAGTMFFSFYPGEDKTVWQAFYMSCVTMTSVGFGAFAARTQAGRLFAAIWMLVGVAATAHMVLCFSNWLLRQHKEIQVGHLQVELLAEMDADGDERVDKCEFLRFELIRTGMCPKEDIDAILSRFKKLDIDQSGSIDLEDLRSLDQTGSRSI